MPHYMIRNFVIILSCLAASPVLAQKITARAGFVFDSLRVGDEIPFYLTASYPEEEQILFPDSTFNYAPFEFRRKEYFTTTTRDSISYDSVVYYLSTFDVSRIQRLKLPVFKLSQRDCTEVLSNTDSVLLQQLVARLPNSLTVVPVHASIAYQDVKSEINYPIIIIIAGFVLMFTAVVYYVFGDRFKKHFRAKHMRRAHQEFINTFDKIVLSNEGVSHKTSEAALVLWKRYMERLNAKPYTKLTTRETMRIEADENLGKSLRSIDAAIYGNEAPARDSLDTIKRFADQRFNKKLQEVMNG